MGVKASKVLVRRYPTTRVWDQTSVLKGVRNVSTIQRKEITKRFRGVVTHLLSSDGYNLGTVANVSMFRSNWHLPTAQISTVKGINNQATKSWSQPMVSDIYEQTRPDYNAASVELLLEKMCALKKHFELFSIVELGAGTGKFTRAVLRVLDQHSIQNVEIVATEPVEGMYQKFKKMVPGIKILQCPANDLNLPSNSADAILAAQSFHWFSNAESVKEIHRVLKHKGMLGIIWNLPDRSVPWIKAIEEMLDVKYRKHGIARPETKEWLRQINSHGGFGPLNENDSFRYTQSHSYTGLINRYKGISVVAAAEGLERKEMLSMIKSEIKNHGRKDQENYIYDYVVEIKWFQKN